MAEIQLGAVESRFADIIWEREPVTSAELIKLAAAELTWKRTTTHTVLRRLCDKGIHTYIQTYIHTHGFPHRNF